MCGIFAWAGKDPRKFNKTKLDILGMYNEARGGHSCGVAKDGEIAIGIDKNKAYKDFLATTGYDVPKKYPVVIGHTRQSTYGAHTVANAHPFGFGVLGEGYKFIGCHNGTLLNHVDLATEFGIKSDELVANNMGGKTSRSKIDSEILLEIIYTTRKYKILSAYNGAAALVFTDVTKPNVVYCYHGESRKRDAVGLLPEEERPLFYWQETKNSVYISSMDSSLSAISGDTSVIKEFDFNTVYEITDGNVALAKKTKIVRTDRFQTGIANVKKDYARNLNQERGGGHARQQEDDENNRTYDRMAPWREQLDNRGLIDEEVRKAHNSACSTSLSKSIDNNIYTEITLKNVNSYGNSIYFNKLRYWRNGHTVNGIYCYISDFGFFFLGYTVKEADLRFWDIVNKAFVKGEFMDADQVKAMDLDLVTYPFEHTMTNQIINPPLFFMFDGIKLKSCADWIACESMVDKNGKTTFNFDQLSHAASHPIIDVDERYKSYMKQEAMYEGVLVTDTFCPLGSEKIYEFVDGNCVKATPIVEARRAEENTEKQTQLSLVVTELEDIEAKIASLPVNVNSSNDLLEDDINDMFKDSLRKFPQYIKRLGQYKKGRGAEASQILNEFINKATILVAIEEKE